MRFIYNDDTSLVIIMSPAEIQQQKEFLTDLLEKVNEPEQILYILRMIERRENLQ